MGDIRHPLFMCIRLIISHQNTHIDDGVTLALIHFDDEGQNETSSGFVKKAIYYFY